MYEKYVDKIRIAWYMDLRGLASFITLTSFCNRSVVIYIEEHT